jgi:hypothetical protein
MATRLAAPTAGAGKREFGFENPKSSLNEHNHSQSAPISAATEKIYALSVAIGRPAACLTGIDAGATQ